MLRLVPLVVVLASAMFSSLACADYHFVKRQDVQAFIQLMVKRHGFKRVELTSILKQVKLHKRVIKHIQKPMEAGTWENYQNLFVNKWRIDQGVKFWKKHANALRQAEKIYHVPAGIIVATIGIETKYGKITGDLRVIDSLANIAFNHSRRSEYFLRELEEFFLLTREQHLDPLKVMGSYAGAIGQGQFMPSSYRRYAINFSKSGRADLIHNETDVIGSIANFYSKHGWQDSAPVASPAKFSGYRYYTLVKHNKRAQLYTIKQLERYGVTAQLTHSKKDSLIKLIALPNKKSNEYWLGFRNFDVIKRYNASDLYAMAIYQLSKYITLVKEQSHHG